MTTEDARARKYDGEAGEGGAGTRQSGGLGAPRWGDQVPDLHWTGPVGAMLNGRPEVLDPACAGRGGPAR